LFGFRPTHGRISLNGVLPFSPSYDTVGWLARSGDVLARAGRVLLDDAPGRISQPRSIRLLAAADAFAMIEPECARRLLGAAAPLGADQGMPVFEGTPALWLHCYQILQGAEIWQSLGAWIVRRKPHFGPAIAPRFAHAQSITHAQVEQQQAVRARLASHVQGLLEPGGVLVMPTIPATALKKDAGQEARAAFYQTALALNAVAGHAGLPQLTIPVGRLDQDPVGLSFVGARGTDEALLAMAQEWADKLARD
jgi:amidase